MDRDAAGRSEADEAEVVGGGRVGDEMILRAVGGCGAGGTTFGRIPFWGGNPFEIFQLRSGRLLIFTLRSIVLWRHGFR